MRNYVVGNWKMTHGPAATGAMLKELLPSTGNLQKTAVWIAPPAVSIPGAVAATESSPVEIGAQNVHWEESGAFTGELSVPLLREVGCSFALTGHSERRHLFAESDELIARRTLGALDADLTVIFCVGELLEEREAGKTVQVVSEQIAVVVKDISAAQAEKLIIAYEPVWAIGTGKVAGPAEIEEAHSAIIDYWNSQSVTPCPPVLYGGSVKPENFTEIIAIDQVAGALVGGASLKAESFARLIAISEESA